MKIRSIDVTDAQAEVYRTLKTSGAQPDVITVPVVQHIGQLRQSSSGIRTRRRELADLGLVKLKGTVTIKGRTHRVWKAV